MQFAASTDAGRNLATIERLVRHSSLDGCDLVVLPEAAMADFGPPERPLGPEAQTLDGPFVQAVGRLAAECGTTIVAGMFESSPDPTRPFNTLVVIGPDGELWASYRKVHLYDSFGYRESDRLSRGEPAPVVVPVGDLRVGLMTCYDLRFPELGRLLVDHGAEVLAVPAAWVSGKHKLEHWSTLLRARAIENTVYVVGAAQTGRTYTGHSAVVDPMGVSLGALGDEEGVLPVDLSRRQLVQARERNPSLANRVL